MGFYHKGIISFSCPLARHLTAIVVQSFQRVAYGPVKPPYFLYSGLGSDGGIRVFLRCECLEIEFIHFLRFRLHRILNLFGDAVGNKDIRNVRGTDGQILLPLCRDTDRDFPIDIRGSALHHFHIFPGGMENLSQFPGQWGVLPVSYLYNIGVAGIFCLVEVLVFELCVVLPALHDQPDIACLAMSGHSSRHGFQQVMKFHRDLESLPECRAVYRLLIQEHDYIFLLPFRGYCYEICIQLCPSGVCDDRLPNLRQ